MNIALRLAAVAVSTVVIGCTQPAAQSPQDLESLKKAVEELKAQQQAMAKDLAEVRDFLKAATGGRFGAPTIEGSAFDIGTAPANGQPTAPVTIVEISDYHCPFCRRHVQQTQPQIYSEYVSTGKVRHVFIHYPIDQLHPDAFRSHEAASCAAEQGKFWDLHVKLFEKPVKTNDELKQVAQGAGLDAAAFGTCLDSGKYADAVRQSVARIQQMGISGTPMFLIGKTPAAGQPMTVVSTVQGAHPYAAFKSAFDAILSAR